MTFASFIRNALFTPAAAHPKILFLHGFTRSGPSFSAQTATLQNALYRSIPKSTRFHFPSAPIRLNPLFDDREGAHAWWQKDSETGKYTGLEDSLRFLGNYLDFHGPFDGVVGFSQGATLAVMLAASLDGKRDMPKEMVTEHGPLGFVVAISGFRPSTPYWYNDFYFPPVGADVMCVLGEQDDIVRPKRTEELAKVCESGMERLVRHGDGHVVPRDPETLKRITDFVAERLKEPIPEDN
ncbi:serine hydrolase FSH [Geopyxis carbonaria]|nr:serine hydrolase FSH [Geopyxis carbonaria]